MWVLKMPVLRENWRQQIISIGENEQNVTNYSLSLSPSCMHTLHYIIFVSNKSNLTKWQQIALEMTKYIKSR